MDIPKPRSKQPIPGNATRVFKGKLFEVYQWEQKLFDGSFKTFEKIKRPATVMILPITDDGKIILTQQEQPGEGRFIGLIGGIVEEAEDVLVAAKRELLEESGYVAEEFVLWDAVQLINKIEWPVYTYLAKQLKKSQAMSLDGGEKIRLKPVTFEEFLKLSHDESFRDIEVAIKIHHMEADPDAIKAARKLFS